MEITSTSKEVTEDVIDSLFLKDVNQDIKEELLSKLSVKSLLRFQCVSQEWHALTKSSYFIAKHITYGDQCSDPHHPCLIIRSNARISSVNNSRSLLGFSLVRDEETMFLKSPFLAISSQRLQGVNFVGCGNGLVFYQVFALTEAAEIAIAQDEMERDSDSMYRVLTIVWNPATKKYRCLPEQPTNNTLVNMAGNRKDAFHLLGFDFVNARDISEYKLVRISHRIGSADVANYGNNGDLITIFEAQVFVQSTNSWRKVKDKLEFPSCKNCDLPSPTVRGVLYWKVQQTTSGELCILSFNLVEEVFNVIQVPSNPNINWAIYPWPSSPLIGPFVVDLRFLAFWVIGSTGQESKCNSKSGIQMQKVDWVEELRFNSEEYSSLFKNLCMIGTWKHQLLFRQRESNIDNGEPINLYLYDPRSKAKRKILKNDTRKILKFNGACGALNYVESLAPV